MALTNEQEHFVAGQNLNTFSWLHSYGEHSVTGVFDLTHPSTDSVHEVRALCQLIGLENIRTHTEEFGDHLWEDEATKVAIQYNDELGEWSGGVSDHKNAVAINEDDSSITVSGEENLKRLADAGVKFPGHELYESEKAVGMAERYGGRS